MQKTGFKNSPIKEVEERSSEVMLTHSYSNSHMIQTGKSVKKKLTSHKKGVQTSNFQTAIVSAKNKQVSGVPKRNLKLETNLTPQK